MSYNETKEQSEPSRTRRKRQPAGDGGGEGCFGFLVDSLISFCVDLSCVACFTTALGCLLPMVMVLIAAVRFAALPLVHFMAAALSGAH